MPVPFALVVGWGRSVVQVGRRPRLWPTAIRQARALTRPDWWRHRPYLPLPDREYVRFRLETQYGRAGAVEPADLVAYLEWCRDHHREVRRRR